MNHKILIAKLRASALHAITTLLVGVLLAPLIFCIWFPGRMSEMLGADTLFAIVLGVEFILGPSMSLVIFNPLKKAKELVRDYSLVVFVQIGALSYGLFVLAQSRPVYIVFVKDRLEIVSAIELDQDDIGDAKSEFKGLPFLGPKLVCVDMPIGYAENEKLMFSALAGKDISKLPKYYRACQNGEIRSSTYSDEDFESLTNHRLADIVADESFTDFDWLPVVSRFGAWTAVYGVGDDTPTYVNLDPFP